MSIEGNYYGQDFNAAERDAKRLNSSSSHYYYEIYTNMQSGGYQIEVFRKSDDEFIGFHDDGDQWANPPKSKWHKL